MSQTAADLSMFRHQHAFIKKSVPRSQKSSLKGLRADNQMKAQGTK